jgi:hypothetical protein
MAVDMQALSKSLYQLQGRHLRVFYLGGKGRGKTNPLLFESGILINWQSKLACVKVYPDLEECRKFNIGPEKIILSFDRGMRVHLKGEEVKNFNLREESLTLLLAANRAFHFRVLL